MFKCLIFIQGLTSPSEKEVRTRLLNKLEQDQKITLQSLAEECQHILNLRADTATTEEQNISNIHTNHKVRKINRFSKLICVMGVECCIYLKTVHLNTKNAILVGAKDTNSHTADLEGEIIQKIKKTRVHSLLNEQQLKKYKENI